jgi:uncharacterized protein (UPF0332 family)
MKPESQQFIDKANVILLRGAIMLKSGLNEDAARSAYMASFHVAQAYIFERKGKVSKSHHGVQTEFFRLTKDDPRIDHELRKFLSQSYEFKSVADYFTGPEAVTSVQEATDALEKSKHFFAHFAALVSVPDSSSDTL